MLPIDDPEAADLLAGLPPEERKESWRLALPDGRLVGHGRGLVELVRALRATRPVAPLLARVPAGVLDRVYAVISHNRDRLARVVPDGPAPRRYP